MKAIKINNNHLFLLNRKQLNYEFLTIGHYSDCQVFKYTNNKIKVEYIKEYVNLHNYLVKKLSKYNTNLGVVNSEYLYNLRIDKMNDKLENQDLTDSDVSFIYDTLSDYVSLTGFDVEWHHNFSEEVIIELV